MLASFVVASEHISLRWLTSFDRIVILKSRMRDFDEILDFIKLARLTNRTSKEIVLMTVYVSERAGILCLKCNMNNQPKIRNSEAPYLES